AVEVNGERREFQDGGAISFPRNVGARRSFTVDEIEFLGYGLDAPLVKHNDYEGKNVKGKAVVWLGAAGPPGIDRQTYGRALGGRNRYATDQRPALPSIRPGPPPRRVA